MIFYRAYVVPTEDGLRVLFDEWRVLKESKAVCTCTDNRYVRTVEEAKKQGKTLKRIHKANSRFHSAG